MSLERMWINCPSKLQEHHSLHGMNILVDLSECDRGFVRIWFTTGEVISMIFPKRHLSKGWQKTTKKASINEAETYFFGLQSEIDKLRK